MTRSLLRLALAGLLTVSSGCGDGSFIIAFNSGIIVGDPDCDGGGGQFDLRNSGGLTVLVVITSSTRIFVSSGGTGSCDDLFRGAAVDVSGRESDGRIVATEISIR